MTGLRTGSIALMVATLLVSTAVAKADSKKARKPTAKQHVTSAVQFCATARTKRLPECADVSGDSVPQPSRTGDIDHDPDFNLGVRWRASSDRYGAGDPVRATVDSINRTVPGTTQSQQDTQVGIGANWRICLFCN